jgi:hypothetical protein
MKSLKIRVSCPLGREVKPLPREYEASGVLSFRDEHYVDGMYLSGSGTTRVKGMCS